MSLVVGHNCPGCGLDTAAVACVACGATVVWDREEGSHCSECGLSASTITCRECGLEAELDKRDGERSARPVVVVPRLPAADDADEPPRDRKPIAWLAAAASPLWRPIAISLAAAAPVVLIGVLLSSGQGPARFTVGAPSLADATAKPAAPSVASWGTMLPVPVQPPPPRAMPDLPPQPPTVIELTPPPPYPPRVAQAPSREGWLRRFFRSGRASSPSEFERISQ